MFPPEAGDGPGNLIGNAEKNFIVSEDPRHPARRTDQRSARRNAPPTLRNRRGLTTSGAIGENALLHAGGGVAQLGEHHVRNVGVEGSIPFSSTTFLLPTIKHVPGD